MRLTKQLLIVIILFLLTTNLAHKLYAQEDVIPLVTQLMVHKTDSVYEHRYLYNADNNKTLESVYYKTDGGEVRIHQQEWMYNNSLWTDIYLRKWDNNKWNSYLKVSRVFDNDSDYTSTVYSVLNGIETPVIESISTFSNNVKSSEISMRFGESGSEVIKSLNYSYPENRLSAIDLTEYSEDKGGTESSRIEYIYNDDFGRLEGLLILTKVDDTFENDRFMQYFYNSDNDRVELAVLKKWDQEYSEWTNIQRTEFVFDNLGRILEESYQFWEGSFWENHFRYRYTYDEEGFLVRKTYDLPIHNDYRLAGTTTYSNFQYERAGTIQSNFDFWGGPAGEGINSFLSFLFNDETMVLEAEKIEISYLPVVNTESGYKDVSRNGAITVYPNPSRGVFYMDTQFLTIEKWIISDLSGKTLLVHFPQENSRVIDLSDFKSGIYILQTHTNEGVKVQRLIKQ